MLGLAPPMSRGPLILDRARLKRLVPAILAAELLSVLFLRARGYRVGRRTIVRCRQGHLFTTIWIPLASFKAIRLGTWRFQRCPVGDHWSLVSRVWEAELTEDERRAAAEHRDARIP